MRAKLLGALLHVILLFLGPSAPGAAEAYRVTGIAVDATAESAVAAREVALDTGQREGLRELLRRLTLPDDAARLPDTAGLPIERYVQSFEIADEKVGPTRYIASLNIAYLPEPVQRLLEEAGVPYLERRPDPVLVLPVLVTEDGGVDLWGEANPWRAAWNEGAASPIVELRLPLGDLGDVSALTPEQVAARDAAAITALGPRYDASLVVLAQARPAGSPPPEGPRLIELDVAPADAPDRPFLGDTLAAEPGEDDAALLRRAVARAIGGIESGLKERLIVRPEDLATLSVGVPLADLSSWVQIKQALEALPEVRSVRVDRFARSGAEITIGYAGDLDALSGALGRVGLSLAEENGAWQLRQAGGLGAYRAPLSASPATP